MLKIIAYFNYHTEGYHPQTSKFNPYFTIQGFTLGVSLTDLATNRIRKSSCLMSFLHL